MQVHERLKTIRLLRSWTQEELADKLGWAVNTYAKIERGESDLKLDKLQQIADVIGVELTELLNVNDRTIFNFAENHSHNNFAHTILLSESQCAHELEKAQLVIAQKEKEIDWLREENGRLKEIIALLRKGAAPIAEPARA